MIKYFNAHTSAQTNWVSSALATSKSDVRGLFDHIITNGTWLHGHNKICIGNTWKSAYREKVRKDAILMKSITVFLITSHEVKMTYMYNTSYLAVITD